MPATDVDVDDPADPRLVDYRSLTDSDLRVRHEEAAGVFIAEGPLVVRELIASAYDVRSVLVNAGQRSALADVLDELDAPVYVASQRVIDSVAGFHLHRGALACGRRRTEPAVDDLLSDDLVAGAGLVAVLERVNDHENLGALYRNARALGVDAVVLCPECCDPLYRRSVRVSMGHVLHVPTARVPSTAEAISALRARGFTVVALTPQDDAEPVDVLRDPALGPVALLIGAEGPGLRPETIAGADRRVRVPMSDGVDSLNVATAAAIAFHEVGHSRQLTAEGIR
ncbi:MAG TPA: RNA methyltransferase [Mycobacteriales bacterium]|nr:RNA methyltransferase [Mycobacteriales bacterium]